MKDLPLIYLYHPINRVRRRQERSAASQIFGDGLIRAQYAGFKK